MKRIRSVSTFALERWVVAIVSFAQTWTTPVGTDSLNGLEVVDEKVEITIS
jgi:hypothetical protein